MGVSKHGVGWRADFTKHGHRHKSPVFDTKKEAQHWEEIRRGDIAAGRWLPEGATSHEQPTVADVLKWYGATQTPKLVTEPHREISRIRTICKDKIIADMQIDELDNEKLLDYMSRRRSIVRIVKGKEKPISKKTIKEELNMINKAIEAAIFRKTIEVDGKKYKITINGSPVNSKMLMKHSGIENDAEKRTALSEELQQQLIAAAKNYSTEVYNFIRLAIATGQRRGELLEQDWRNVHIDEKYLISKNKAPKTQSQKKTREVPLSPTARKILTEMGPKKSGLLFPTLAEEVDRINDSIAAICRENALPHITPHQFRHTCETNNQLEGVIEDKRKLLLGRTIKGSTGTYSQAQPRKFADEFV